MLALGDDERCLLISQVDSGSSSQLLGNTYMLNTLYICFFLRFKCLSRVLEALNKNCCYYQTAKDVSQTTLCMLCNLKNNNNNNLAPEKGDLQWRILVVVPFGECTESFDKLSFVSRECVWLCRFRLAFIFYNNPICCFYHTIGRKIVVEGANPNIQVTSVRQTQHSACNSLNGMEQENINTKKTTKIKL